jgi:hypothetical protein
MIDLLLGRWLILQQEKKRSLRPEKEFWKKIKKARRFSKKPCLGV